MENFKKVFFKTDVFILCALSLGFFLLILADASSWYYSAIGDEYAFFSFAKNILTGQINISFFPGPETISIFSQKGVYDVVPIAGSLYQAMVMNVFGINHQGWIISSILLIIFSLWFFYFLIKDMFGKRIAIFSSLFFITSHYLWAFTHLGYWNIHVLATPLAAFFFFFRGVKKKRWYLFFLAGIFAGLGFYTYFTARITLPLLLLWCFGERHIFKNNKILFFAFIAGVLLFFTPFALVNKEVMISQMLERSAVGSKEIENNNRFFQGTTNVIHSLLGFYNNTSTSHFVSGSLIDPLTGILFSIGLLLFLRSWRKRAFFLFCFFFSLITVAGFSPYPYIPITRLFFLLPFTSCLAGYALDKMQLFLQKKAVHLPSFLIPVVILLIVFILNLYRFYVQTPKKMYLTPEALAISTLQSFHPCTSRPVIISQYYSSLLAPALSSYDAFQSIVFAQNVSQLDIAAIKNATCIIFLDSDSKGFSEVLGRDITKKYFLQKKITSPSGSTNISVFFRNDSSSLQ